MHFKEAENLHSLISIERFMRLIWNPLWKLDFQTGFKVFANSKAFKKALSF